jgi:hypothetical protein
MNRIVSSLKFQSKETILLIIAIVSVLLFLIGFLVGFFSVPRIHKLNPLNEYYSSLIETEDHSYNHQLIEEINAKNIETHLR